jgi:hypothetical protein
MKALTVGFTMRALILCGLLVVSTPVMAYEPPDMVTSVETQLDLDAGCVFGGVATARAHRSCQGLGGYGVAFASEEGRVSLFFGHLGAWYLEGAWESFEAENAVSSTIEWRLVDGEPIAAIQRWRVFHDADDPEKTGEMLVVSKVGQPGIGEACVTAYVDAKANDRALDMARELADTLTSDFQCRVDDPVYHGEEGLLSGFPVRTFSP